MKYSILTLMIMITVNVSFGQTFIGKQSDKFKRYNCSFRINKDSSVNFIYDRDFNGVYGDHYGSIKKINDTIYIQLDSNIARQLDKIQIEYTDGKTRKQLQGYDRMGNPIRLLKVPVDKKLFNEKKGMDFITITINRKNFLTDNFLSFKIPFGSATSFTSGQKITFDVIIKNNKLWTVGQPPLQTGHFKLDKKSGT